MMPSRTVLFAAALASLTLIPTLAEAQKTIPQRIQYVSPMNGALGITRETSIIIRPGDPLSSWTIPSSSLTVTGSMTGKHTGTLTLSTDRRTVIFKPSTLFGYGEKVTVELAKGWKTAYLRPIDPYTFSFKIMSAPKRPITSMLQGSQSGEDGVDVSAVDDGSQAAEEPAVLTLSEAYPNPFSTYTELRVTLSESSMISLVVFDAGGHEVSRLAEGVYVQGEHPFAFDGSKLASGVYHCVLRAGNQVLTRRLIVSR